MTMSICNLMVGREVNFVMGIKHSLRLLIPSFLSLQLIGCEDSRESIPLTANGSNFQMILSFVKWTNRQDPTQWEFVETGCPGEVCVANISVETFLRFEHLLREGRLNAQESEQRILNSLEVRILSRDGSYMIVGGYNEGRDINGRIYNLSDDQYSAIIEFAYDQIGHFPDDPRGYPD